MPIPAETSSLVTVDDIAAAMGRTPSELEATQWSMWISDALMLVEARLGDLGALDQVRLAYVVRESVIAHIKHPDDATTIDVAVDDGRVSRTYRSSAGRVTIRDEWWDLLAPNGRSRGAFSIVPTGSASGHLPWCNLMFGATYCSCGVDNAGEPIFEVG